MGVGYGEKERGFARARVLSLFVYVGKTTTRTCIIQSGGKKKVCHKKQHTRMINIRKFYKIICSGFAVLCNLNSLHNTLQEYRVPGSEGLF